MIETLIELLSHHGFPIIFFLLMLGIFGLPIPDEFLLAFAGALISKGRLHFVPTILSATLGSMCGITLSYVLGRTAGIHRVKKYGSRFGLSDEKINHVHMWFERAGRWVLTFGYFIPGLRHIMALIAGTSKLELSVFTAFAYTGGFIWSCTFILLGYFVGVRWAYMSREIHYIALIISFLFFLTLTFYSYLKYRKYT
jgi:membrane protein DedA with SNARE-associated domain